VRPGDPVPAISEDDATDEVAELYADIRKTLGVPLVNLIWRNLATIPGALAWAWLSVKPLYETGQIQNEAQELIECQQLPVVPELPNAALRAVGVDARSEGAIRGILESYDRSNPLNLVALCALLAMLRNTPSDEASLPAARRPRQALDVALPALVDLHEMSAETAELVRALNRLGTRGRDHILVLHFNPVRSARTPSPTTYLPNTDFSKSVVRAIGFVRIFFSSSPTM